MEIITCGSSELGALKKPNSREKAIFNFYLVTKNQDGKPLHPSNSDEAILFNSRDLSQVDDVLINADLSFFTNKDNLTIWMLEDGNWISVTNELPEDPFNYKDYGMNYRNNVRNYWYENGNGIDKKTNRFVLSFIFAPLDVKKIDLLFFKPKTKYSKYTKINNEHALRFLKYLATQAKIFPMAVSNKINPLTALEMRYREIGEGNYDDAGYKYNYVEVDKKYELVFPDQYYYSRTKFEALSIETEKNVFPINNGVYRFSDNGNWKAFASTSLLTSETLARKYDLLNSLEYKQFVEQWQSQSTKTNKFYPTFDYLPIDDHPKIKKWIDSLDLERLDDEGTWVKCSDFGYYNETERNRALSLIEAMPEYSQAIEGLKEKNSISKALNKFYETYFGLSTLKRIHHDIMHPLYYQLQSEHVDYIEWVITHRPIFKKYD